ncbi:MAG: RNA-binding S4 domain-containing protein [Burkholderiales bacterium]|nr:RNA-binding S4 domain-containing protein [Burkholderiales bacterium]
MERARLDKFLWAARFFKSRSLSADAVVGGKVRVNGERAKPAKEIKAGDRIELRAGDTDFAIIVASASDRRGSAEIARTLYEETAESRLARAAAAARRRRFADPAADIGARPTKKDRRELDRWRSDG